MNTLDPLNLPPRLHCLYRGTCLFKLKSLLNSLREQERKGELEGQAIMKAAWIMATCHRDEYEFYALSCQREDMADLPQRFQEANHFYTLSVEIKNPLMEQRFCEKFLQKTGDDTDDL